MCCFVYISYYLLFRIQGEQVNIREQHDAFEFFNKLVDSCDEALKTLGMAELCSQALGGSYADQKICKDCPHRSVYPKLALIGLIKLLTTNSYI